MTESHCDRSFELISEDDLSRLAQLALADIGSLFERRTSIGALYRNRLIALCLCQGAAEHFVRPGRGVKDFDVWAFFMAHQQAPFPARRRGTADFGLSRFGKHPPDAGYTGRRVDVIGRSLSGAEQPDQTDAIRRWLSAATTTSARHLRLRPVIAIYPEVICTKVLWDPAVDAQRALSPQRKHEPAGTHSTSGGSSEQHQEDRTMSMPQDPREEAEKAKKKPGGQQHQNPPRKTSTDNPERNPRDQKGRGGSK